MGHQPTMSDKDKRKLASMARGLTGFVSKENYSEAIQIALLSLPW